MNIIAAQFVCLGHICGTFTFLTAGYTGRVLFVHVLGQSPGK